MSRDEVRELREQLYAALAERDFLQKRLNAIRETRGQLLKLIQTPTLQERIEAGVEGGELLKHMGRE